MIIAAIHTKMERPTNHCVRENTLIRGYILFGNYLSNISIGSQVPNKWYIIYVLGISTN